MNIVSSLKELNRRRLARRRRLNPPSPKLSLLRLSTGETIELASREVHLSGTGSRTFHYRPHSTGDLGVMRQIFESKDYDLHHWPQGQLIIDLFESLRKVGRTSLILDLGSNIGASAVFFGERYKGARLICVEPDITNGDILHKNMEGLNHALFRGAISSTRGKTALIDPGHGDWGFRTAPISENQPIRGEVSTETVEGLLEQFGQGCVPMVAKIDIEGAEADLFAGNCEWMDAFPCIIIELHDWMLPGQGSSQNFLKQVAARELDFVYRGENIFLFNLKLTHELAKRYAR